MAKILSYKSKRENVIVIVSLIISIVVTNSFTIFSPDKDSRFYFSALISTVSLGVALVISIVMVYKYKRSIKKQQEEEEQKQTSPRTQTQYAEAVWNLTRETGTDKILLLGIDVHLQMKKIPV